MIALSTATVAPIPRPPLQPDDLQVVNLLEVTYVSRPNPIAEFQCGDSDRQVRERDANSAGLALAIDLAGSERDPHRDRLDRHTGQQLIKEPLASIAALRGIGSYDPMREFEDSDHRNSDSLVAATADNVFEQLAGVLALTLGGNSRGRVKHQSH